MAWFKNITITCHDGKVHRFHAGVLSELELCFKDGNVRVRKTTLGIWEDVYVIQEPLLIGQDRKHVYRPDGND